MLKHTLFFAFMSFFALGLSAQSTFSISGKIKDDAGEAIVGGSVMLLHAADSILQSYSLTNAEGKYSFKNVPAGNYVLKALFNKHQPKMQLVSLEGEGKEMDLGTLTLTPIASQIEEVEITDERIPIRIKGDSIEYDAKAFSTQPNDNVEELIKKLPGMEVDGEGNIKAQGETVTKILVDGKEFFGDDPKVASKNLPAEAIDKVQVFDKKSDVAEYTGMDDGVRTRTINLALKEDYKTGYFGNVMAGYGTKDRYETKANLNRFGKKSQLSVLGQLNNTNQQGFSFQDYMSFVGGVRNLMNSSGGSANDLGINLSSDPTNGYFTTGAGGLNANFDISPKTQITTSYFYNYLQKDIFRDAWKQTILESGSYLTEESGNQQDKNANHRGSLYIKQDLDSLTRISLRSTISFNSTISEVFNTTTSTIPSGNSNTSVQDYYSNGDLVNSNSTLNLLHRYKKKGRSSTLVGTFQLNPQSKEGLLSSYNSYYSNSALLRMDTISQDQIQDQGAMTYGARLGHTEPIGNRHAFEGYLDYEANNNTLDKNFFDLDANGENPVENLALSNNYSSVFAYQKAGLNWKYYTKQLTLTTGAAIQNSTLDGEVFSTGAIIQKQFLNILPNVSLRYRPKNSKTLRIDYRPRINAPTITQLQPVPDNSNPLNIILGNPDLRAEYAHNLRLNYNVFDQFSFSNFFIGINGTYTQNKISQRTTVDSLLRQTTQPVNVANDLNIRTFASFGTPIRKLGIKTSIDYNSTISRSIVFINASENYVNRFTNGGRFKVENKKKTNYDAQIGLSLSHTLTLYQESSQADQSYLNSTAFAEVSAFLPKGFIVMTGFDYSVYSGAGFTGNQTVPLWRAYVSKKVFKNQRGLIKIAAFDLLNRNVGITRNAQINYLQEEQINTLSRYFLGSFTYSIVSVGNKR